MRGARAPADPSGAAGLGPDRGAAGVQVEVFGDDLTIEYPFGSGRRLTLDAVAHDLEDRLISIFLPDPDRRRPCFGGVERLQTDPAWKDNIIFSEYFHGDNGAGLGASHQTGWTGTVGDLIRRRYSSVLAIRQLQPATDH